MRYLLGWPILALLLVLPDKPPTIAEAMRKLNGGTTALTPNLAKDLKDAEPDWEGIQESTQEYVKLVEVLPGGTPSKGDKASWKRLAETYLANAKALDAAAKRKDRRGASAALARIQSSCKACHQVHRKD